MNFKISFSKQLFYEVIIEANDKETALKKSEKYKEEILTTKYLVNEKIILLDCIKLKDK